MITKHRTRDKHHYNPDSLSKKTEFYERQEQKEADRPETKDGFSFMDKETYDSLQLTMWLEKSRKNNREPSRATTRDEGNSQEKNRDANGNDAQVEYSEGNTKSKKL